MNAGPWFWGVLKVFWLILPAAAIVAAIRLSRLPWFKGRLGEFRVSRILRRRLDPAIYQVIDDVLLTTADGSTQIDHVVVSRHGVFVVETKNMRGVISGRKTDRLWTQEIGGSVRSFQNPLHQNYKHANALQELLSVNAEQVFSLVVFVGRSSFGSIMPDNVVQGSDIVQMIKARRKIVLGEAQTAEAAAALWTARKGNSAKARKRHVEHVQSLVAAKAAVPQPCPLCGSPMVLREARRGRNAGSSFWGCTQYPACQGTANDKKP